MSDLGIEVISNARARIDAPFRNHFKPENLCNGGRITIAACMERGMDQNGYDCSGLAIASICDVLAITTARWPPDIRHTQQLAKLADDRDCEPGDIRLYISNNGYIHLGIATTLDKAIHASAESKKVEEGQIKDVEVTDMEDDFVVIRHVALDSLVSRVK